MYADVKMAAGPPEGRPPESSSKPLDGASGLTARGAEQFEKRRVERNASGASKGAERK